MSAGEKTKRQKKNEYFEKLVSLLEEYPKILLVTCDNIGSAHMQKIRKSLRGKAVLLMGKNTMIRRAIRLNSSKNPDWMNLLPHIYGNVGMVFTKDNIATIRDTVQTLRVPASAKAGTFAPKDVFVAKGMTKLEPTKTNFLQALNIASKINKGQIEILNDIHLIKKGERIGSSEATLLQMLDVRPFEYGLYVQQVYDHGSVYGVEITNLTDDDIVGKFAHALSVVTSVSLGIHYPTLSAVPHLLLNSFKNLVALSIGTSYEFEQGAKLKDAVLNPGKFAAAAPAAKPAGGAAPAKKPEPEKVVEKPKEPSDDGGAAFDLFG